MRLGHQTQIFRRSRVFGTANAIYKIEHSSPLVLTNTNKTLPAGYYSGCAFVLEDRIYIFGGTSGTGDNIWYADLNAPDTVLDSGKKMPVNTSHDMCFRIGDSLYVMDIRAGSTLAGAIDTYKTTTSDPTEWSLLGSVELAWSPQNSGVAIVVGEFVYAFATHMSQSVLRAPISNPSNWENLGDLYPAIAWGTNNLIRHNNAIYFIGGNGSNYLGTNKIIKANIVRNP